MQMEGIRAASGTTRKIPAKPVRIPARIANNSRPVSAERTAKYKAPTIAKSVGVSLITDWDIVKEAGRAPARSPPTIASSSGMILRRRK
jgi:hypothetical protein